MSALLVLRRSPMALAGALIVLFWVVVAALAPVIAPFDPNATMSPSQHHKIDGYISDTEPSFPAAHQQFPSIL